MKVDFDDSFRIQGCEIVNYLLEKSRVVFQSPDERNYHIFYQLISGADKSTRDRLSLLNAEDYRYLNQSGCIEIPNVDDKLEFQDVLKSMNTLEFSPDLVDNIFNVLGSILNLGNLMFQSVKDNASGNQVSELNPTSESLLQECAKLLGIEGTQLELCLLQKFVQMGKGSIVAIKLTAQQSSDSRDTLVKTMYGSMFDFIISRINDSLKTKGARYAIGILDIFGFEVFELNSFEQLCINYANEKLQHHFNEVIFSEEMKMYEEEGIPIDMITFVDNSECVKLIENKPYGLILLLDEECSLGNGTDASYISKIDKVFGVGKPQENKFFVKHRTKPLYFSVKHFAGPVEYCVTNFIDKNRDTLSVTCRETMMGSDSKFIADLFKDNSNASSGGSASTKSSKVTLGSQFRNQLISLITTLKLTEPHFIRCVKPNHQKQAGLFDGQLALRQLRYAGLFEAIRIRKSGFAYRAPLNIFANTFQHIIDGLPKKRKTFSIDDFEACRLIVDKVVNVAKLIPANCAYVGKSKVFLKSNNDRGVLDQLREDRLTIFSIRLQACARGFLARMRANRAAFERKKLLAKLEAERKAEEERLEAERKAEEERLEAERKAEEARLEKLRILYSKYAIIVQKCARRYIIKKALVNMREMIELRKALCNRNIHLIETILTRMEKTLKRLQKSPTRNSYYLKTNDIDINTSLKNMYSNELRAGRTMLKYIEIQDKFITDMNEAIARSDVTVLNQLLIQSERLELTHHPIVELARKELGCLHKKKVIVEKLVEFLQNQSMEVLDTVPDLLSAANEHGVDREFIHKVRTVYEDAGPRLRARTKLRKAVEVVDEQLVASSIREIESLRRIYPDYAEIELRAGKELLKLIAYEKLCYESGGKETVTNEGRLDEETISLFDMISRCSSATHAVSNTILLEKKAEGIDRLNRKYNHDKELITSKVRAYKWSKMLCVWNYPEVATKVAESDMLLPLPSHKLKEIEGDEEFFGLKVAEARSCIHLVKTLHGDIDPKIGSEMPGSVLAALGISPYAFNDLKTKYYTESKESSKGVERFVGLSPSKSSAKKGVSSPMKRSTTAPSPSLSMTAASKTSSPKPKTSQLPSDLARKLQESRSNVEASRTKVASTMQRLEREVKTPIFKVSSLKYKESTKHNL